MPQVACTPATSPNTRECLNLGKEDWVDRPKTHSDVFHKAGEYQFLDASLTDHAESGYERFLISVSYQQFGESQKNRLSDRVSNS